MTAGLIKQIQESPTRELHDLKTEHANSLVEAIIDMEIRIRSLLNTVKKLERDYINRNGRE